MMAKKTDELNIASSSAQLPKIRKEAHPMTTEQKHLAKNPTTDGYGEVDQEQRSGDFLKFLDGAWSKADLPVEPSYRPLAYAVDLALTHWCDQKVIDEITDKPLPDLDELNSTIPKEQWELGLNGDLRPPWSGTYKVFFLDQSERESSTRPLRSVDGLRGIDSSTKCNG
jgi:hypothetical protein